MLCCSCQEIRKYSDKCEINNAMLNGGLTHMQREGQDQSHAYRSLLGGAGVGGLGGCWGGCLSM